MHECGDKPQNSYIFKTDFVCFSKSFLQWHLWLISWKKNMHLKKDFFSTDK